MKNLKDILAEGILADIETTFVAGDEYVDNLDFLKKITNNRKVFYEFVTDYLKTHYKKYKRPISRSRKGLKDFDTTATELKNFDPNKKYFLISLHKLNTGQNVAKLCINIKDKIHATHLTSFPAYDFDKNTTVGLSTHPDGKDYDLKSYLYSFNAVYEVPNELEWLYNYIKQHRL